MLTGNQTRILDVLTSGTDRELSMSDLGRALGRHPGVFQRGLNSLEEQGYVVSRREGNMRLISFNRFHPSSREIIGIVRKTAPGMAADFYMVFPPRSGGASLRTAEPPGAYESSQSKILIIAGPNGAGKTTFAREFLQQEARCSAFINADYIAHGFSPFSPETAALRAGRLMLHEINDHIRKRDNVAFETTLSGRRYAKLIPKWRKEGYRVKLVFLFLFRVELAIARVAVRTRQGGHDIPEETIRRRYESGRKNFDEIYKSLVDAWALYDNSGMSPALLDEWEVST